MIQAQALTKSYRKRTVLNRVSFDIPRGHILAVAGANGAGKTTLLKLLALILKPTEGRVRIEGEDASKTPGRFRRFIGYVPQANAFFHELTVKENLEYWASAGFGADTAARLGLEGVLGQRASSLSGGMQRRLNLALGLMHSPRILIMDEPLTGVDIKTRASILGWMTQLKQMGMTVVYSTHHADEIDGTADSLLVLRDGAVTLHAAVSALDGAGGTAGAILQFI
jgi:ABC-2 type transport system ATP-binding protein